MVAAQSGQYEQTLSIPGECASKYATDLGIVAFLKLDAVNLLENKTVFVH